MRVAELMEPAVRTISPDATIRELVELLAKARVSGVPVVDAEEQLLGVVSAGDVLRAEADRLDERARGRALAELAVRDVMTPNPHVIGLDDDVREAAKHMLYAEVRRLFVVHEGRLVGVISQTDIAHAVGRGELT